MSSEQWTRDVTMRYLNEYPLPETFTWHHRDDADPKKERPVQPVHRAVTAYGKWLRETPYFQGLFELIHDLLSTLPDSEELGGSDWLAEQIKKRLAREQQEKLF